MQTRPVLCIIGHWQTRAVLCITGAARSPVLCIMEGWLSNEEKFKFWFVEKGNSKHHFIIYVVFGEFQWFGVPEKDANQAFKKYYKTSGKQSKVYFWSTCALHVCDLQIWFSPVVGIKLLMQSMLQKSFFLYRCLQHIDSYLRQGSKLWIATWWCTCWSQSAFFDSGH